MKSAIHRIPNRLLCLGICVMLAGASHAAPAPVSAAVTYEQDIRPILGTSCVSCHGPKKEKAGFRADQRDDLFRKTDKGPLVVPGDSGGSRLVAIVSGTKKVKRNAKDHLLSQKEVALIKAWIDAGAR